MSELVPSACFCIFVLYVKVCCIFVFYLMIYLLQFKMLVEVRQRGIGRD